MRATVVGAATWARCRLVPWGWTGLLLPALMVLLIGAGPAWAQAATAGVRLDGRELLRLSAESEVAAVARARRVEGRLQTLSRRDGALPPARVGTGPAGEFIVTVGDAPVVTVTAADAEDNLTTAPVLARQWAQSIDRALQDAQRRQAARGGRFLAEIEGSVQTAFGRLLESLVAIIPRVLAALLVVSAFWLGAAGVRRLMRFVLPRIVRDRTLESLLRQLTFFGIVALGLAVAADALGFSPTSVAAGLGLTGLVLGFALKDILSNFVSGVLILALRPFEIGDQIVVGGETEGTVERIELRATQIRTYDGRVTLVPNAEVFTSRITNNTADPIRRGNAMLRVGYDADLKRVSQLVPVQVALADGVLASPPPRVRIADLGPSDITLNIAFWTDSQRTDFQDTSSAVRLRLVEALREAGIGLPNPDIRILKPAGAETWAEAVTHNFGLSDLLEDRVAQHEHDHEDGDGGKEDELGDADSRAGDPGEAKHAGDQPYGKKY